MKVIGLIGGIGTGKSEVAMLLKNNHQAYILLADPIGHQLMKKGMLGYEQLVDCFGKRILDNHGEIDRKLLGTLVFDQVGAPHQGDLEKLNAVMHPLMYGKIKLLLDELRKGQHYDIVILEAAVMIEAKFTDFLDALWCVTCPIEKRIHRLMTSRSMSLEKIKMIISKQRSLEEYMSVSNVVIDNGEDLEHTAKQIKLEIDKMLEEDHEK